jgi:hypothetical protein
MRFVKVVRYFTDAERAWIRLMQNPYASLALLEPDDEEAMIAANHSVVSLENNPEPSSCPPSLSTAAPPSRSPTI